MELVFGEYLGEAIGRFDGLGRRRCLLALDVAEAGGIEDIAAHAECLGGLLGDGQRIARDHLDLHAHLPRRGDGCLGVFSWRVEKGQHAKKPPRAISLDPGHAQGAKTPCGELVDGLVDVRLHLLGIARQLQDHLGRTLGHLEGRSVRSFDGRLGTLAHRVERLEVGHLKPVQRLIVFQAAENRQIDGVIVIRARRQCGAHDDLLRCNAAQREGLAERQFVLGQGAGLVSAEHVHAGQLLDGHQAAHDGLLLREETRADRHRDRQHRRHRHGDRGHGEHQGELQRGEDRVAPDDGDDGDHAHQ